MTPAATTAALSTSGDLNFQAFDRTGLLSRAAPFLGAMWLAIMVFPLPPQGGDSSALIPAAVLNALIVIAAIAVPWRRLPYFAQITPAFAYFVAFRYGLEFLLGIPSDLAGKKNHPALGSDAVAEALGRFPGARMQKCMRLCHLHPPSRRAR